MEEKTVLAHLAAGRFLDIQQAIEQGQLNPRAGSSLLCLAAKEDAVDLMRCLTSRWQIDPNQRAGDGATPLWAAISARKEAAALFLINEAVGVDLPARGPHGATALMHAAAAGMVGAMKALIAIGADVEAVDESGRTALRYALEKREEAAAVWLLEEAGAVVLWQLHQQQQQQQQLALAAASARAFASNIVPNAIYYRLHGLLRALLRRMQKDGLDEAEIARYTFTAALYAIEHGRTAALKLVLEEARQVSGFAILSMQGQLDKRTLLHQACNFGEREAVAFLVESGADPFAVDGHGLLPHQCAAGQGYIGLVEWFLSNVPAIGVDSPGPDGVTALHVAAYCARFEMVKWLTIAANADIWRVVRGRRASELAASNGHVVVAEYLQKLEQRGTAQTRAQPETKGAVPLQAAVEAGAAAAAAAHVERKLAEQATELEREAKVAAARTLEGAAAAMPAAAQEERKTTEQGLEKKQEATEAAAQAQRDIQAMAQERVAVEGKIEQEKELLVRANQEAAAARAEREAAEASARAAEEEARQAQSRAAAAKQEKLEAMRVINEQREAVARAREEAAEATRRATEGAAAAARDRAAAELKLNAELAAVARARIKAANAKAEREKAEAAARAAAEAVQRAREQAAASAREQAAQQEMTRLATQAAAAAARERAEAETALEAAKQAKERAAEAAAAAKTARAEHERKIKVEEEKLASVRERMAAVAREEQPVAGALARAEKTIASLTEQRRAAEKAAEKAQQAARQACEERRAAAATLRREQSTLRRANRGVASAAAALAEQEKALATVRAERQAAEAAFAEQEKVLAALRAKHEAMEATIKAETSAAATAAELADDEALLRAAISLSLSEERPPPLEEYLDDHAPDFMLCPITLQLMDDPVLLAGDGCTYSRAAIEAHLDFCRKSNKGVTSPKTNLKLDFKKAHVTPNVTVRSLIMEYKQAKLCEWEELERRWREQQGARKADGKGT